MAQVINLKEVRRGTLKDTRQRLLVAFLRVQSRFFVVRVGNQDRIVTDSWRIWPQLSICQPGGCRKRYGAGRLRSWCEDTWVNYELYLLLPSLVSVEVKHSYAFSQLGNERKEYKRTSSYLTCPLTHYISPFIAWYRNCAPVLHRPIVCIASDLLSLIHHNIDYIWAATHEARGNNCWYLACSVGP